MPATMILLGSVLALQAPQTEVDPEPPPPGPVGLRLVAKKRTYKLDTGGLTADEYLKAIKTGRAGRVPVDLELVIFNSSKDAIRVQTRGNKVNQWLAGWTLKLSGPGVADGGPYWSEAKDRPPAEFVVLRPGQRTAIPLAALLSHMASVQVRNHFWTEPGEYTLSALLMVPVSLKWDEQREKGSEPKTMTLRSRPIKLTVEK